MKRREELSKWLDIMDKHLPQKDVFVMMWVEVIKVLRAKIKADESWSVIEEYAAKGRKDFAGVQERAGPHAAQCVFKDVSAKVWSINRKYAKSLKQ